MNGAPLTPVPEDDGVLVCGALREDTETVRCVLSAAGIPSILCADPDAFRLGLSHGPAAAIIDEQVITSAAIVAIADVLRRQPAWSDIPIIVLATDLDATAAMCSAIGSIANILTLERPVHDCALVSAVSSAIRARRKQYQIRDLLVVAETDRRKNEFLATLGHELRNPLAALRTAHSVLVTSDVAPQCAQPYAIIDRQITNLSTMVDDLLDVSRVISGKLQVHWQDVDLNEIIEHSCAHAEPRALARRQTLHTSLYPRPALVKGDPVRLEQVVVNLLDNASKYTPENGHIWVDLDSRDGCFAITVRDDGCGIAPSMLPTIFQPFTQALESLARSQGGLGLGLPLVRGLTSLHGGSVRVLSDGLGAGSTFVVTLPRLRTRESVSGQALGSAPRELLQRERGVLIIDDNPDIAEMMKLLLERYGCRVELAHDGSQGVDAALTNPPEIALVDIGLPILDGYEVARRIRSVLTHTRLIAVTGYSQLEDKRHAMEAGFDEHLVKPIDLKQIEGILLRSDLQRRAP